MRRVGLLMVVVAGSAVFALNGSEGLRPIANPAPTGVATVDPAATGAVWPETSREAFATATLPSWRTDSEATALHYASEVLGWPSPAVASRDRIGETSNYHLRPETGSPVDILVSVQRVFDTRHWSVTHVWGFATSDRAASVAVGDQSAHVSFDYWGRASSAELTLVYGADVIRRTSRERADWTVPITFPLAQSGAVTVLFRDSRGTVFAGWATAVTAGTFAAG